MLHENAKQRLWRVVPESYDIEWYHPLRDQYVSDTVALDPGRQIRWARQGSAIEYPVVYLDVTQEGEPRGDMDHYFEGGIYKEPHPSDEVAYTRYIAEPMYATLTVTVAVKQGTDVVPKNVLADEIARQVWHEFRFETQHLDSMGTDPNGELLDYAWPMAINRTGTGIEDVSRMLDEQPIERRQFQLRIDYAYFDEENIPSTKALEVTFGLDIDYDDEVESSTGQIWIDEMPHPLPQTAESVATAHTPTINTD